MPIKRCSGRNADSVANDGRLSFLAMGVLTYMLAQPDDWKLSVDELSNRSIGTPRRLGKGVLYDVLNELIDAGYIERQRLSKGGVEYTVHDTRLRLVHGAEGLE